MEFQSKMPRKSHANRARAANLQRDKRYPSQATTIEEVEEENFHGPDSHRVSLDHGSSHTIVGMRQDSDDMTSLVMMQNFLRSLVASEDQQWLMMRLRVQNQTQKVKLKARTRTRNRKFLKYLHWYIFRTHCRRHMTFKLHLQRNENERRGQKIYNKNSNRTKRRC